MMPASVAGPGTGAREPAADTPATRPDDLTVLLQGDHSAGRLLSTVVEAALGLLPGLAGASVSILVDPLGPRFETAQASSEAVKRLDEIQYMAGSGPCVDAATNRTEVRAELPAEDWPAFSEAAEQASVRTVWSLPLEVDERVGGALNLYAADDSPWGGPEAVAGRILARQASAFLAGAMALAQSEHTNSTLRRALETRTVIGQAQGVLIGRQGITAEEAFDILRRASQRTNRKLRDVAAEIVESVSHGRHRE